MRVGDDHPLLLRLLDEVRGAGARHFLTLLESVERQGVLRREFYFNIVDVLVDFTEGWAEISDVLDVDTEPYRIRIDRLRQRIEHGALDHGS